VNEIEDVVWPFLVDVRSTPGPARICADDARSLTVANEDHLPAIAAMADAYNDGRVDELVDTYFSADARLLHVTRGIDLTGREALRDLYRHALERWPDRTNEIIRTYPCGDTVVVEKRWRATDRASGEKLEIDQCYIYRFEDGKIAEQREYG
jgi:ketosteroid isomerase-like protein